jgi:ABC-type sugar transport system ATPase subunit
VTHDQEEAMTLGTRIAVLRDGFLEQVAPAVELFQRPANAFVAGFVGAPAMNFWPCVYRGNGGRTVLVSPAGALELEAGNVDAADGTELLVGVRPHDIELVSNGGGDAVGRVAVIEPLGAATVIHLDVGSASPQLVRVVVPDAVTLTYGDLVAFRLRRDRLHVFDARTGGRVSR